MTNDQEEAATGMSLVFPFLLILTLPGSQFLVPATLRYDIHTFLPFLKMYKYLDNCIPGVSNEDFCSRASTIAQIFTAAANINVLNRVAICQGSEQVSGFHNVSEIFVVTRTAIRTCIGNTATTVYLHFHSSN